jgi:hypothetical protein
VESKCDLSSEQVRDRINEFGTALRIAADRLDQAIDELVNDDAAKDVSAAIAEFRWDIERELKRLKEGLAR